MADQTQSNVVQRAVDTALADIKKYAPEEFQELEANPDIKQTIITAAKEAAVEHLKLAEEFSTQPSENVAECLTKYLPKHRLQLIESGLQVPTYRLDISKKSDGQHYVDITREGKEFMPSKKLNTIEAIDVTSWIQHASIIVEAVLLAIQAVGIQVALDEQRVTETAEKIIPVVKSSSQFKKAVEALEKVAQNGSKWEIAKAIFFVIKDTYSAKILLTIIKSLCRNMSKWEWIKTAAMVSAMIIAALATDGAALIAKIVLALNDAYEFYKKLKNLVELNAIKVGLKK